MVVVLGLWGGGLEGMVLGENDVGGGFCRVEVFFEGRILTLTTSVVNS